jgi:NAD(P)-dependent dehydrogenase (short-subunit alcohol dehydrogenase family)
MSIDPSAIGPYSADVRLDDEMRNPVDQTVARFGHLDVAVNNAGPKANLTWLQPAFNGFVDQARQCRKFAIHGRRTVNGGVCPGFNFFREEFETNGRYKEQVHPHSTAVGWDLPVSN